MSRYASVYPLVTARAVARPFTYEIPEEAEKGAVVEVRFGNARRRGVVTEVDVAAPEGVEASRDRARRGDAAAGARRSRAVARRLLRLDAGARARARRAVQREAARRAKRRRDGAVRSRPRRRRRSCRTTQERALARIAELLDGGGGNVLLYGATGSGKTEVYIRACEAALARGRGAIVLVPEIALTPQTLGRFRVRFGDRVAVLHSALTEAERRDERERIASGEAPVVVGARSAVFAPVPSLGVICIDEEHDSSYKQESDPRYDARTVAAKRASLEGAVAVFGSATPRPESWASARAARARRADRGAAAVGEGRRPAPRGGLSALGAAAGRARRDRRARRQGDPAPESPRRRAGDALPRVRRDAALPELRRRADAARRRVAALPPLRPGRADGGDVPCVRLGRARAHRRGHAEARARAREARCPSSR